MENLLTISIPFKETNDFDRLVFGWIDYSLFGLLLLVSILIGINFGLFSKQDTMIEYLLGGKRMRCFSVAMSIIAGYISGITLLGIPAEVFHHGTQYAACVITAIITAMITSYIFLPVFYKLQLNSTFKYLEIRFSTPVRILSSVLFTISLFMYIPIVIYVPAIAFAQVTNFSIYVTTPVFCIMCIIYTSIGGLKAIIWTDNIQISVTFGGLFAVLMLGILSIGSIEKIWKIADEGGRLIIFDMNPSPFARNTFWSMIIGETVMWIAKFGVHPGTVQRFLSMNREIDAKYATVIITIGVTVVKLISMFFGLMMFAKYYNCDPFLTKAVSRTDQILPYYVMDIAVHLPGFSGFFLAGLVSAGLTTMSANLNTMSGTVYEDFISPWIPDSTKKEAMGAKIMKIIVVISGAISMSLVFLVEKLGTIFHLAMSMRSVTDGPYLGLLVLGTLVPWANAKGAILGGCISLLSMFCLVGGNHWYSIQGKIKYNTLPTSVNGCPYLWNQTILGTTATTSTYIDSDDESIILFKTSFMYYTLIGALITIVVGIIASFIFGIDLKNVDHDHIAPMMRRFLPPRRYEKVSLIEMPTLNELKKNKVPLARKVGDGCASGVDLKNREEKRSIEM